MIDSKKPSIIKHCCGALARLEAMVQKYEHWGLVVQWTEYDDNSITAKINSLDGEGYETIKVK